MEAFFAALEGTALAQTLRLSRWGYATVNATHILGIALLFGAIVPLNLRLLGLWQQVPRQQLVRVLVPVAATGLGLAVLCGALLFSVRAREYADLGILQVKLALVLGGTLAALAAHTRDGFLLETASAARLRIHALISITCWIGAIYCGRLIAFADG